MIRPWVKGDTPAVHEIEKSSFSDPWTVDMLEEALLNPAFCGFVCEEGGEVEGYVGALYSFDAEIALIAVRKELRGRGIGLNLLQKAIDHARERGCENVFLEVRKGNLPAKSLYFKVGFRQIGERRGYYSDGEDALVMALSLT